MSLSLILKNLANFPRSVKAAFLICVDAVILGFSMLLAFAVRFDPASLEHQFRVLSEGIWVLMGMQLLALLISGL